MIQNFDQLMEAALRIRGKRVVVIYPANEETFSAAEDAARNGIAACILVGDEQLIRKRFPSPFEGIEIVHQPVVREAMQTALELVREGRGDILLKGGVDTATMMKAVLAEGAGIRTERLLSDVFMFEWPARGDNKFLMITDGGLTPAPDLKQKAELIQNAVEVAHALGNAIPKVAVLSATEFVMPYLQSTIDAAALVKMNERGQIKGCVVDGPLALDNAVSPAAAGEKRISSPVAGQADILLAPTIEAANSLAKSTTLFAALRLAHVIVGGRIPVLIPSRADKSDAKLLSIALGVIMSDYYQKKVS